MNVIDYSIKEMDHGFELSIVATSPSPHWTHIGLYVINHPSAPKDGVQEMILEGTPPNNNYQLTNIQKHTIAVHIVYKPWLKMIKIRNSLGDVLKSIRLKPSTIKRNKFHSDSSVKDEDYSFNELYFAEPNISKTNAVKNLLP
mgnify:CR=1 FL=1